MPQRGEGWTYAPARCAQCRRLAIWLQARHWLTVAPYGLPVGASGPQTGLELTRPVLCCSWRCLSVFALDADEEPVPEAPETLPPDWRD